jgi:Ca2+-binding EF-hand superfamily protein
VIGASKCYVDHFNAWLFGASYPTVKALPSELRVFADAKFLDFDQDNSGAISPAEALDYLRELLEERGSPGGLIKDDPQLDADSFFLAHDANNDGLVSKAEFDSVLFALWTPRMAKVAAATSKTQPVSFFFRADENSDDYVTEEEMRKAYPLVKWSAVLVYDDDKDGKLFQGEFHNHTSKLYKLLTGERYDLDADMEGDNEEEGEQQGSEEEEEEDQDERVRNADIPQPTLPILDDEPEPFLGGIQALTMKLDHEAELRKLWQISDAQGQLPIASPTVVSKLTEASFRALAERGVPLIVSDGLTAATDVSRLTCSAFKQEFPKEPLKMCEPNCTWKTLGDTDVAVRGKYWEYQALGQNTQIGGEPYVRTAAMEKRMQEATEFPYFLPKSEVNQLLHKDHLHLFFGTQDGTRGAFSDMTCFWSVFSQAHGSSHWRLTIPYNVRQLQTDNPSYTYWPGDGAELVTRMVSEFPVFEFSLRAGQMLVLPPGLLKHFTMTDASGCSVMFRTAFMDPAPVHYVRALIEPLMSDSDGAAGCYTDHYNKWLFGSPLPDSNGTPDGNELYASGVFAALDANGDNTVSRDEAAAYFPPKSDRGAIRTPENDADAFIRANDADGNGTVSFEELEATILALWTPVMRDVGGMWFFVDSMNALAGGGWPDYGRYVDSIRFNFASRPASFGPLPDVLPQNGEPLEPVPKGFPISVNRMGDDVIVARASALDNSVGFVFWPRLSKSYIGPFRGNKRVGTGVFCCKGDQVFDQMWNEGDDDEVSFAMEPKSDELVQNRSDLEVVNDIDGLLWMGPIDLTGVCAVLWKDSGSIYVGPFVNGRREGPGVLFNNDGTVWLVNWLPGQDETDWISLLQLPPPSK